MYGGLSAYIYLQEMKVKISIEDKTVITKGFMLAVIYGIMRKL